MVSEWIRDNPVKTSVAVVLGVLIGFAAFQVTSALRTFGRIASEDFDPRAAGSAIEARRGEEADALARLLEERADELRRAYEDQLQREAAEAEAMAELEERLRQAREARFSLPTAVSPTLPDEMFNSILLIGADESGFLADVIIDVLLPSDGASPMMVSIPRDLYLPNRCTGGYTKVNANLGGCRGMASGPELLALAVGDFTGVAVDHFVRVDFDGFATVVDRMGGATVCVGDRPVRDERSGLDLPAGCHLADGYTTLAWVRSRNPQYLIDGEWKTVPGSDFDRHRKQQDVLFQFAERLSSYSTLASLSGALENLASAVRMDSGWSVGEAASLAFRYRGITREQVVRLDVPVENLRTSDGALALAPTRTFNEVLAAAYPAAAA